MKFIESRRDILSMKGDYSLVQCIYADFQINSNTVQRLENVTGVVSKLKECYPDYYNTFNKSKELADCLETSHITGDMYSLIVGLNKDDPVTYTHLQMALSKLKAICLTKNIKKLAISLDGINLPTSSTNLYPVEVDVNNKNKVKVLVLRSTLSNSIEYTFSDTDIHVVFCNPDYKYERIRHE